MKTAQADAKPKGCNSAAIKVRPDVRLYLMNHLRFFGAGPYRLLSMLSKESSLKSACATMKISYSKGMRIIVNIEEQLGVAVVHRQRGGISRGQSELTENGKMLLTLYEAFLEESREVTEQLFQKHFSPWLSSLAAQQEETCSVRAKDE